MRGPGVVCDKLLGDFEFELGKLHVKGGLWGRVDGAREGTISGARCQGPISTVDDPHNTPAPDERLALLTRLGLGALVPLGQGCDSLDAGRQVVEFPTLAERKIAAAGAAQLGQVCAATCSSP